MRGLFQRGFERNMPAGLLESLGDEERQQLQSQYSRSALADIVGSLSGTNPGYSQRFMGTVPGLLEQSLAAQQAQRQQGLLEDFISATGDSLTPYQVAAIRANPKLIDQFVQSPTLSAGQAAFTPYGRMMAERAPTSVLEEQYQMGQMGLDPEYLANLSRLAIAGQGSSNLGAGVGSFNLTTGERLAAQPTPRMQEAAAGFVPEDESAKEIVIRQIMEDPQHFGGIARARRLANRQERIEIVPALGLARRINEIAGTVDEIPLGSLSAYERSIATQGQPMPSAGAPQSQPSGEMEALQPPQGSATAEPRTQSMQGLYSAAEMATGPLAMTKSGFSQYVAPFDPTRSLPIFEKTIAAQRQISLSNRNLQRALANSPRYPEGEMRRIAEATNIEPRFFDTPEALQIRLFEIEQYIQEEVEQSKRVLSDPNQPAALREDARRLVNEMEQYLASFGPKPDWLTQRGRRVDFLGQNPLDVPVTPLMQEPDRPAPPGVDPELWRYMTPEGRLLWNN